MADDGSDLKRFKEAAIAWAAGGRGQPLVDAAAEALAKGVDSPTLRILAGSPHSSADEEARELAPSVFCELGLDIQVRLSPLAIIEGARQLAREFLARSESPRELTRNLYSMYISAGYPTELQDWTGFDDYYDMVRSGVIAGSVSEIDAAVRKAAQDLADGRETEGVSIGSLFVAGAPTRPRRRSRVTDLLRRPRR